MSTYRTLYLGLAKKSTGEATYMVRQLSSLSDNCHSRITLKVNILLEMVVSNFKGDKVFHDISELSFPILLDKIKEDCNEYDAVFFIDLNCFFLEYNISEKYRKVFFKTINDICKLGKSISFIDYFGSFTQSDQEYINRLGRAREGLRKKAQGISLKGKMSFYFHRIVPERMKMQLIPPLPHVNVLRPVPLNRNITNVKNLYSFSNNLDIQPFMREKNSSKTVFFALSRFFEYSIEHQTIKKLCSGIFTNLFQHLEINKIICIDPFSCLENIDIPDGLELVTKKWLNTEDLYKAIDNSLFTGLFIPYGTIGTIALNRGVPFVYFSSNVSSQSSKEYEQLIGSPDFPGFNALGVWEDEVFYPDLIENNPYFKAAYRLEISETGSFQKLKDLLDSNKLYPRIENYQKWIKDVDILTFDQCLLEIDPRIIYE